MLECARYLRSHFSSEAVLLPGHRVDNLPESLELIMGKPVCLPLLDHGLLSD